MVEETLSARLLKSCRELKVRRFARIHRHKASIRQDTALSPKTRKSKQGTDLKPLIGVMSDSTP
jgi:hypothetical protein